MILFDFRAPSVNSFNRKRRHIGIRIIYYPINGYPDSKLSVLSIPIVRRVYAKIQFTQTYVRLPVYPNAGLSKKVSK